MKRLLAITRHVHVIAGRTRAIVALVGVALLPLACGSDDQMAADPDAPGRVSDPGPVHVHGLGIDPADDALFIATHTGLFRAPAGEKVAERVGDLYQDTMGFTVTGPGEFLGSGHPDGQDDSLPPFLGLIRSEDAGRTWDPVSLTGDVDFHVLEASDELVYGYGSDWETREALFLRSDDEGQTWQELTPPEPVISLAISPRNLDQIAVSGERGVYVSSDRGASWKRIGRGAGLIGWVDSNELIRVSMQGTVSASLDQGRSWQTRGSVGGHPAAFEAIGNELYVALHDGTIKFSTDGGRGWKVRSKPEPVPIA